MITLCAEQSNLFTDRLSCTDAKRTKPTARIVHDIEKNSRTSCHSLCTTASPLKQDFV